MKATSTNLSGKLIEILPNTTAPLVAVYMYNRSVEYDPQRALAVGFFITRVLW
jgi:hypothetical protein